MVRTARDLVLAIVLAALSVGRGHGQAALAPLADPGPTLPAPRSMPAAPGTAAPARFGLPFGLQPALPGTSCPAGPAGGPPACAANEDRNGTLLVGDPLLDGPGGTANLGWIGSVEFDVLKPVVHARLGAPVNLSNGNSDNVVLPFAGQSWTVMPRLELGYRFGQGAGEVLFAYRFLLGSGSQSTPTFDALGGGVLHSSLNVQFWDLDWAGHESSLGPNWDMKWRVGVRMVDVYSDTVASGVLVQKRYEEFFMGAGPHLGLELRRKLWTPGLAFYSRIDNAYPIGPLTQTFEERLAGDAVGNTRFVSPTPLTTLQVQLGLDYCYSNRLNLTAGYSVERIWDLVTFYGVSRGESISLQGFFVSAKWKY